jgi:hypothetical protein
MRKIILAIVIGLLTFLYFFPAPVYANNVAGNSAVAKSDNLVDQDDIRAISLNKYLNDQNSPLAPYSGTMVYYADFYQIDWRLVPAITGVESSFGIYMPAGSFNAYGWAGGEAKFDSWEASIKEVSKTLSEKYYAKGLDTPNKIGPVYAPPSTTWSTKVNRFMEKISQAQLNTLTLTI